MPTSPVEPSHTANLPAPTIVGEWRRLGAFLKRPTLERESDTAKPLNMILRIYALDMAIMFALILLAGTVVAMGVELPETALAGIEITPLIALGVIFGAPILEELLFRGWLSGNLGKVIALPLAAFALLFAVAGLMQAEVAAGPLVSAGLTGILAGLTLYFLRGRCTISWFARVFPLLFWGSTLAFALIHLGNFEPEDAGGSLAMLLPLVIPQFVLGALLGYLRVKIGLWAAILLHAMHNATALGIALLAMAAG